MKEPYLAKIKEFFTVSIPYRFNERTKVPPYMLGFFLFQFLIGSMKALGYDELTRERLCFNSL